MTRHRKRIVVAGMVAGDPGQGGATWATLQWVLGLRDLGHDVVVVDQLAPDRVVTPAVLRTLAAVSSTFGLGGSIALLDQASGVAAGMSAPALDDVLARADVLVNLSGRLRSIDRAERVPTRVFVDLDPGFVQVWEHDGNDLGLRAHTHAATVGQNIGTAACTIPTLGREWIHVMPPVVLRLWPAEPMAAGRPCRLTTTANWRSYGSVCWDGRVLGQKAHSVRSLVELPKRSSVPLELALEIHPGDCADLEALERAGWCLTDPLTAAGTPERYRSYIAASCGEIGIAKQGYVAARTGWVSDRSASYAASGRPLVLHDTGASALAGRDGVLLFHDTGSAAEAIERFAADPARHAAGARALAEELFDSRAVLAGLLEAVGV